jgi:hypothetical protein
VVLIVHLDDAPGVRAPADLAAVGGGDDLVRADDGEGDLGRDLLGLGEGLFVLVVVGGRLEDVDVVVRDVREDLRGG